MKAIVLRQVGGPEALHYEEVPTPVPGTGEVLVQLKAAALNRRDLSLCQRASTTPMLPLILGSDGSGVVAELGPGVTGWRIGQPVVINPALNWGAAPHRAGPGFRILGGPDQGTYAEFIAIPAGNVYPKPDNLTFEEAAACPVAGLTAWRALVNCAMVRPGEIVLIPGVGSGVATFAVQIAKRVGATVYVTSHSDEKLEKARQLGVDGGVNYQSSDWPAAIRELTRGHGVDIILDSTGRPTFAAGLDLLAAGGRLIVFGATGGAIAELDVRKCYSRHLSVLGTTLGSPWDFEQFLRVLAAGRLRPIIDTVFPLAEAAEAHRRLDSGMQFGKIALIIT